MVSRLTTLVAVIVLACCVAGCAVNPVTGQKELSLVSETWEVETGREQYVPARQMAGGDYVVDPELSGYVQRVGGRLAAVADRGLPYEFAVVNDGTPNAWALPGGKIAVHRGLLTELENEAELAAVLGHEIVHSAARHGAKSMERGLLLQGAVLAAGMAAGEGDYAALAVGGSQLAAVLVNQKFGREAELEADYYGMEYMRRANYDPAAAVSLQETFVRLSEGRRQGWLEGLFASHPPSPERVAANRQRASELPPGGELGKERYRAAIARLERTEEAYAAYEKGRKALADGNLETALDLAGQALAGEPAEALFHELRGDVRRKQGRLKDALTNYDRAIERNGGYFRFHLQRGLVRKDLGETAAAEQDLERSLGLLPTAPALYALGEISLARGDRGQAKEYFAAAAESDSAAGRAAAASLIRLDLPDRPGRYLRVGKLLGRGGYLVLEVGNPTPLAIRDVVVQVTLADGRRRASSRLVLEGTLAAGAVARQATAIGPLSEEQLRNSLAVEVVGAVLAE